MIDIDKTLADIRKWLIESDDYSIKFEPEFDEVPNCAGWPEYKLTGEMTVTIKINHLQHVTTI